MPAAPVIDLRPTPPESLQATQFAGLLEESRDLICERLDKAVSGMLGHAKDALTALITETRNFEERRLYEEARAVVMAQRQAMEKQFKGTYLAEFRKRADRATKIGEPSGIEDSMGQLSLVGEDDFEESLKFNNMAAKLRTYCYEELVALDQRVGVLLGDANLQAADNPFNPQLICDAYKQACRFAHADVAVRRVLLKLFDDHVLDDVRSMYKDVNALLVKNSILPKIRYSVARSQDRARSTSAGAAGGAEGPVDAPPSDITTGVAQDLFAVLQNLAANHAMVMGAQYAPRGAGASGAPAAGQPAAGVAVLQGADLQNSLTRIQLGDVSGVAGGGSLAVSAGAAGMTNVLRELKMTSVGAGMSALDAMTLDIITMLFDQLFDDPKVPNGVKGLIGRLQIPMLKVTLADKSFFATKAHPARRLLDTLGDVAARLPADFGPEAPLFARLQSIVEALVEGFRDDMEIFVKAREEVEALLVEEDRKNEQETLATAKRVEEMEILAIAKRAAAEEVKARVDRYKLPGPVREFLVQHWLKLLLLIHVKEGKDSEGWKGGLEAMDLLIWTIEPKTTNEERRKVSAVIPGLVRKLAVGMKAAGVEDDTRKTFFARLLKYHRNAITLPAHDKPGAASAADLAAAQAEGPAAAEQVDISLDFTAPVTVKNPFGEGDVHVEHLDMDFAALEAGKGPAKGADDPLTNLTVGVWVEFREVVEPPVRKPGKLIFVTPRKTRYLFALDRAGKDILQCTPGEICRRFRVGDAVFIDEPRADSLFDRIMKGLVSKLRNPAPAIR